MKKPTTIKTIASSIAVLCHSAVFSHDGHGLSGSHWHATDTLGFVVVVAVAVWLLFGRK